MRDFINIVERSPILVLPSRPGDFSFLCLLEAVTARRPRQITPSIDLKIKKIIANLEAGRSFAQVAAELGNSSFGVRSLLQRHLSVDEYAGLLARLQGFRSEILHQRQKSAERACDVCGTISQNPRFCSQACEGIAFRKHDDLYPRIEAMVAQGVSRAEIAAALGMAESTVSTLLNRYRKRAGVVVNHSKPYGPKNDILVS